MNATLRLGESVRDHPDAPHPIGITVAALAEAMQVHAANESADRIREPLGASRRICCEVVALVRLIGAELCAHRRGCRGSFGSRGAVVSSFVMVHKRSIYGALCGRVSRAGWNGDRPGDGVRILRCTVGRFGFLIG